jgi:predicted DNA-binding protein
MTDQTTRNRAPRSIRLTIDVNDRLIALCNQLGVTPNSYLIQAIGKAITQDELHFKLRENSDNVANMMKQFTDQMTDFTNPQLPLDKDL